MGRMSLYSAQRELVQLKDKSRIWRFRGIHAHGHEKVKCAMVGNKTVQVGSAFKCMIVFGNKLYL